VTEDAQGYFAPVDTPKYRDGGRARRQSTVTEEAQEYFAPVDAPKDSVGGGARIFCAGRRAKAL
jgi:hypothetical protein